MRSQTLTFNQRPSELRFRRTVTQRQIDRNSHSEIAVTIRQQVLQRLPVTTKQIRRKRLRRNDRQWIETRQDRKLIDALPYLQTRRSKRIHAGRADGSGQAIDAALLDANEDTVAHASVVVAQAKVLSAEIALLTSSKLFELAGTRSVLGKYNLDRHWRNARTHTLHDPARWKFHLIGNYLLNGVKPARHAWN